MSKPADAAHDIAVIGMGCRFPHAKDLPSLWRLVSVGEVAFEDILDTRWKHSAFYEPTDLRAPDKTYVRKGAFIEGVEEFAALHYGLAPRRVQVMDPQQRLVIEATRQALQDAGYDSRPFDRARTGVFIGASVSEYKDIVTARHRALQMVNGEYGDALSGPEADIARAAVADVAPARAFTVAGGLLNMIACSVSQTFDLSGPAMQLDAACSSALVAIHEATVNLRARQCNLAIAGGVYLNLTPDNLIGFSRIGAISPSGACRPFDAGADGFVMGEGVGLVVLKRLDDALRDGDRIYAVLRGSGCNNDGRGDGPMTPRPEGQRDAMGRAHADVDFPVESIGYVETHGTATTVGDVVEVGALKQFFTERSKRPATQPSCYLGSIKANIGHTMSAAGVAGFMKACLMLHHRVIPPQPGITQLNPKLELERSPFRVATASRPWEAPQGAPRRAAVSSFGFGGTNAHVLLEEAPPAPRARVERPELFLLSAPTPALLAEYAKALALEVEAQALEPADVAVTLASRASFPARVAFVVQGRAALLEELRAVAAGRAAASPLPEEQRRVGFLFPGQGAQRVGLLKDLVDRWPSLAQRLRALDDASRAASGCSLLDALYPPAGTDALAAQRHLTQTHVCQPAMAALGIALGELLRSAGVEPQALLGHSLGEFAAAAVAGMLDGAEAVKLVARRGQAMRDLPLEDPGAMLAVMSDRAAAARAAEGLAGVVVANDNHPTQVVLSGPTAGIEEAAQRLAAAGVKATRLDVSHAFHSPLMAGVDATMARLLEAVAVEPSAAPVVSCIAARPLTSGADAKEVWTRHATSPVRFVEALRELAASGVKHFIQVGAGQALLSFARPVAGASGATFSSLAPAEGGDGGAQLLGTLGQLWLAGVPVKAQGLLAGRLAPLPPTPLEQERYWVVERTSRAPHRQLVSAGAASSARSPAGLPQKSKGVPMDNLLALFQQQNALLQAQAEVLKAQASAIAAMAGGAELVTPAVVSPAVVPPAATASPSVASPASAPVVAKAPSFSNLVGKAEAASVPASPPQPVASAAAPQPQPQPQLDAAPKVDVRPSVVERVMASVARISAFPLATLKPEQTLVGELGFDSLMLVELDTDVGKAFPSLGGLPRELFSKSTTVGHVIEHLVKALDGSGPQAGSTPASGTARAEPVGRYVPAVVAAPLAPVTESVLSFQRPLLVTRDGLGIAEALVARLQGRGVACEVGTAATPGDFGGVVHLAGVSAQGDYRDPARALLELSKRLGADRAECFVTLTGLGGHFGYEGLAAERLGQVGALGFTKALSQEWPDAVVKAVDVDPSLGAEAIAERLVEELVSADRSAEVGFTRAGRVAVALEAEAAPAAEAPLGKESVVVVTGGAKGVGLKLARALGKAFGCAVALVGRSAPSEELAKAAASVKAAGARVCTYHAADVRDAAGMRACLAAVRAAHGRVDGVVHAAGVLADALVGSKTARQLDAVLETKVGGALALLEATESSALELVVLVGSWAGRFGNAAQVDYSAANEMMARLAVRRAGTRTVAIDFPPWEDSEMARKIPGFKKTELKEQGVTFLSDEEGVTGFLAEVVAGEGEVLLGRRVPRRVVSHVAAFPVSRLSHVYLNDHTMAGQRVLPFAAALDHVTAAALDAAGAKGQPLTVTDFRLKRAILVPDTTWLEVAVKQRVEAGAAGALEVTLSQGHAVAYQGVVSVGASADAAPAVRAYPPTRELPLSLKDFYGSFTFHGPRLQGITAIEALGDDGVVGWVKGCRPADWVKDPKRGEWTVDPLVVDASFQLAGYWAWVKHQRAGFPVGLGRLVQLAPFGAGPLRCTVSFETAQDDLFTGTLVWHDASGRLLAFMTGMQAEFKKRDPQFKPAAAEARPAPKAEPQASAPAPAPVSAPPPAATPDEAPTGVVVVDEATWNPAKFPEYEELQERIQMAEAFGLKNPYFSVHEAICGDTTVVNGKPMINFSSYNYVGNSGDPIVTRAAQEAVEKYGTSVSASRVASGEKPLTRELERALADFFGTEDCIVLVSGHATNVSVVGHVVGASDLILHDALAHDSIIQGAKLSGAKRRPFPHNDYDALDRMLTSLRPHYRRVLIAIEGTYSMDGDIPELPRLIEIKKKHKAMLLVDEAHSAGVVGDTGRGVGEYFHVNRADVDMWMGTLSKSFASCGGYICGSHALVEYLKYTTPGFIYSVGISPPNAAAALAATHQLLAHPERARRARENAARFIELLKARGINTGLSKDTAVVPAIIGNSVLCLQVSDALKDRGINVQPILYPAVEEDQARLRFFLSSLHKEEQLVTAADVLKEELDRLSRELGGEAVA